MKAQNWDGSTGWFWTAFIGHVLVTLLCFAVPVAVIVLVPLYLVVGITVMRQNQTQGPHRLLGFTLMITGTMLAVGIIFAVLLGPLREMKFSSIKTTGPYGIMQPGGYTLKQNSIFLLPENTVEAGASTALGTPAR